MVSSVAGSFRRMFALRRPIGIQLAALLVVVPGVSMMPRMCGAIPVSSVTIAGSFQSELGCPGDWQPGCGNTELTTSTATIWRGVFSIPAGAWEYKVALNGSWDESYPAANKALNLGSTQSVRFYYDADSHWVADSVNDRIPVIAGDFQSELGATMDWDPTWVGTLMNDADNDGTYTFTTSNIPAGYHECKVAMNESWTENYPGANYSFTVNNPGQPVTFTFVSATNTFSASGAGLPVSVSGFELE